MAHIKNDKEKKDVKGRKGAERKLPSGKLEGESVVGVLRQTTSSGTLSRAIGGSNTVLSLQQLHCFV